MVDAIIGWLTGLPTVALYAVLAIIAAVENVFPPIPADMVVALGSWLAARGKGSAVVAFLAPVLGNLAGAAGMYYVGRTHGSSWMRARFPSLVNDRGEQRLRDLYGKYGIAALVLSRFIPGVRALVPPFAGAMHLPPVTAIGAMGVASAAWYGTISYLAFRAGSDWDSLARVIARSGTVAAIGAVSLLLIGAGWWFIRRRANRGA